MNRIALEICPSCGNRKLYCKATSACYKKAGWMQYQGKWIGLGVTMEEIPRHRAQNQIYDGYGNVLEIGDTVYIIGHKGSHKIRAFHPSAGLVKFAWGNEALWESSGKLLKTTKISRKAQIADDYNEGFGDGQDYASERVKSEYDSTAEQYGDSMIMELERLEIDFDTVPPNYDKGFKDGYKRQLMQQTGIDLTEGGRYYSKHAQAPTYEDGQAFAEQALAKGINTFGALQTELSNAVMENLGIDTGPFADGYWDFLKVSGQVLDSEYIASALVKKAQGDFPKEGDKVENKSGARGVIIKVIPNPDGAQYPPLVYIKWETGVFSGREQLIVDELGEAGIKIVDEYTPDPRYEFIANRNAQATDEEQEFAAAMAAQIADFAADEKDVGQLVEMIGGKAFARESRRQAQAADILNTIEMLISEKFTYDALDDEALIRVRNQIQDGIASGEYTAPIYQTALQDAEKAMMRRGLDVTASRTGE